MLSPFFQLLYSTIRIERSDSLLPFFLQTCGIQLLQRYSYKNGNLLDYCVAVPTKMRISTSLY